MRKMLLVVVSLVAFGSLATAQTQIETKWHCDKPTGMQKYDVGDPAGHGYAAQQGACSATASKTGEKSGAYAEMQEWTKDSFTNRGRLIVTLDDGDKQTYTFDGMGNLSTKSATNKWKIVGGTGKHKSDKASGSCTGKLNDDQSSDWECTGTMAAAAATAPKK